MGFGDFLKMAGAAVVTNLQERNAKILQWRERYENYDDEKLFRIVKSSSYSAEQKIAAAQVLRSRGYGSQNED